MRRISLLERSLGQFAISQPSGHVCRSCRLRATTPQQRRQIQSSTQHRAEGGLSDRFRSSLFGKKSTSVETSVPAVVEQDSSLQSQQEAAVDLPAGWSESPEKDPNYIEATTWDNLERVGSDTWVEDQFDPYDSYEGWTKLDTKKQFSKEEVGTVLAPILGDIDPSREVPSDVARWSEYKLSDLSAKFEIAKLLQQREGVKVSDFALNNVKTLSDLARVLIHKPEPKKVAQRLQEEDEIKELANIKVHTRRVTPVDKEKAVGRWKIIEQELLDRGLPSTTSKRYGKNTKAQAI